MIPNTIRYQPKLSKLCRFTNSIRNFIAASETRKATIIPIDSIKISFPDNIFPSRKNFSIFKQEAPNIIGIAIKNENSAAATRETPESIPPNMVDPERDVPGIKDKT